MQKLFLSKVMAVRSGKAKLHQRQLSRTVTCVLLEHVNTAVLLTVCFNLVTNIEHKGYLVYVDKLYNLKHLLNF